MPDGGELTGRSAREKVIGKLIARDGYHGIALSSTEADRVVDVVVADVIAALEQGYHPQNPSGHHPADYVTKRFELPGHEGLQDA